MQGKVLETVMAAVNYGGFLTADMVDTLARDTTASGLQCLIRAHEGRTVVNLSAVPLTVSKLERKGWQVRDVSLTADECARLREHG